MKLGKQVALAAIVLGAAATAASAQTVVGKVMAGPGGIGSAVVWIEGAHGTPSAQALHAVIDQQNKVFIPHVVGIVKGGTVEFRNSDDFLHNTYSQSKTKTFDLHQPNRGSRSLLKVDEPGPIEVRCHIHGTMQAWVIVVDSPFFAVTDGRGIFRIDGVPPGSYHLKSWSEQYGTLSQPIQVTKDGGRAIVKYANR